MCLCVDMFSLLCGPHSIALLRVWRSCSVFGRRQQHPTFVAVCCSSFPLLFLQSACRAGRNTVSGYFLAGRDMTWWPVSSSLLCPQAGLHSTSICIPAVTSCASFMVLVEGQLNGIGLGWRRPPSWLCRDKLLEVL